MRGQQRCCSAVPIHSDAFPCGYSGHPVLCSSQPRDSKMALRSSHRRGLAISKLLPKKWRWATSKTLNLMGQFLQMGGWASNFTSWQAAVGGSLYKVTQP